MNRKLQTKNYSLTIGWLYPDLMNTYGDRGNIEVLQKRCEWRGIEAKIIKLDVGFEEKKLQECDILFMGGAQDSQQIIVSRDFSSKKKTLLRSLLDSGVPGLYICGAYQFLGKYYEDAEGKKIPGLDILGLHTEHTKLTEKKNQRMIGDVIINTNFGKIIGFENHGGKTYLSDKDLAFGKVVKGFGNNGEDKTEGIFYRNSIGTYLHGPILPKNPEIADFLIKTAIRKKYKQNVLKKLDDSLEKKARDSVESLL